MTPGRRFRSLVLAAGALLLGAASGCSPGRHASDPASPAQTPLVLPPGPAGDLIHRGQLVFEQTPRYGGPHIGNKLSCGDCHLAGGTAALSAPMIDLAGLFPMFNQRAGHIISLQDRIEECITRSENGTPLPHDSRELAALTAYIDWLSRDQVRGRPFKGRGLVKVDALTGDPRRGAGIYASECASCHGADGAGVPPILPPLWGPDSFNDGAGISRPAKMAAFLLPNMPQNDAGSLMPQEAFDVSAYILGKPRPRFNKKYAHL